MPPIFQRTNRARRALAMTLAVAVSIVTLAVSAAVAGTGPDGSTAWSQTRWVGPGDDRTVTLQVESLPKSTTRATFRVVVQRAADPTRVSVCGGATVTTACKDAAPTPARHATSTQTVDVGADRRITLHSTTSAARVTVSLVGYTVSQPSATAGEEPSSSSTSAADETPSEEPSISETSLTASPTPTTAPSSLPSGGWPGASNTGVPAGTSLTVLEPGSNAPPGTVWSGNVLKVTTNGTVLDSLEIRGLVRIDAGGVVIKNCLITGQYIDSSFALVYVDGPGSSVTVQDSELYAKYPSAWVRGVIGHSFTLVRDNIHDVTDNMAITGNDVVVKDCWLHSPLYYLEDPVYNGTPSHDDNAQIQQGRNITFTHNTMEGTHNSAMQITQDAGVVGNVRLEYNLIGYGGCSLNFAQKNRGPIQGITLQSNRFTHTSGFNCPIIISAGSRGNLTMDDNRWVTWDGSSWVADMSGTVPVQTN